MLKGYRLVKQSVKVRAHI